MQKLRIMSSFLLRIIAPVWKSNLIEGYVKDCILKTNKNTTQYSTPTLSFFFSFLFHFIHAYIDTHPFDWRIRDRTNDSILLTPFRFFSWLSIYYNYMQSIVINSILFFWFTILHILIVCWTPFSLVVFL
jgi:hypothetical protein